MSFIWKLNVVYGKEPGNSVKELTGQTGDINKGFDGEYVWLVPVMTSDPGAAATSFQIIVQEDSIPGMQDVAKGAGGDYRYIVPQVNPNVSGKVTEVMLFRSENGINAPPAGWDQLTSDINKGRGGDFLYLICKTRPT